MKLTELIRLNEEVENLDSLMYTFCDWLKGDAMSGHNEEGERISPKPYHDAIRRLAKLVTPTRKTALRGKMYRGVMGKGQIPEFQIGTIATAMKGMQSWSPEYEIAASFATEYDGEWGALFHAKVEQNKGRILLSVQDVYAWGKANQRLFQEWEDHEYGMEMFVHQDELLILGKAATVSGIERFVPNTKNKGPDWMNLPMIGRKR